jgi:hypothetical protein
METKLIKLSDGTIVLERNQRAVTCPHTQPAVIPGKFQGTAPTFQYMSCGSQCALFNIREVDGFGILNRGCSYNEPSEKIKIQTPTGTPELKVS